MTKLGVEHSKGRRLYVGTLRGPQTLVGWDLGAIACSGLPYSYDLCVETILVSS